MKNKLYFCFPYKGVGGVSLLFLRIAEYMVGKSAYNIFLIDYADGFMAKNVKNKNLGLLEYSDSEIVSIDNDSIVIFQSMTPWSIFPMLRLSEQTKILFWNCHPFNLIPTMPGIRSLMQTNIFFSKILLNSILYGYKKKVVLLLLLLQSKKSIVFMDTVNVSVTEQYLGVKIKDPIFIPIPANDPNQFPWQTNSPDQSVIRFLWVGRICDFKFSILLFTIKKIEDISKEKNKKFKFTVVGNGEFLDRLKSETKVIKNITIEFISHIEPTLLDEFIVKNTDIMVAMGTSALEAAKLGIPTILLDLSYGSIPQNYHFKWLYERNGYLLGDFINKNHTTQNGDSLNLRMTEFLKDSNEVGAKCKQYFEKNHSLSMVSQKLLSQLNEVSCVNSDLVEKKLLGRGVLYSIFSKLRGRLRRL
jgi:hypothetical protein